MLSREKVEKALRENMKKIIEREKTNFSQLSHHLALMLKDARRHVLG